MKQVIYDFATTYSLQILLVIEVAVLAFTFLYQRYQLHRYWALVVSGVGFVVVITSFVWFWQDIWGAVPEEKRQVAYISFFLFGILFWLVAYEYTMACLRVAFFFLLPGLAVLFFISKPAMYQMLAIGFLVVLVGIQIAKTLRIKRGV